MKSIEEIKIKEEEIKEYYSLPLGTTTNINVRQKEWSLVKMRIELCLNESEKTYEILEMGSDAWLKERGEILGYKTSLECFKRVEELKGGKNEIN